MILCNADVHTTKHDQIEQHISKKKIKNTCKIIVFRLFLLILLCNQRPVATGCSQLPFFQS